MTASHPEESDAVVDANLTDGLIEWLTEIGVDQPIAGRLAFRGAK
jgi:hypothetical protein